MIDIPARKARLLAKLNEMNARIAQVEDALDDPLPKDSEEAAIEREDDEVLEEVGQTALRERAMIIAALERIVAGEYGRCTRCGAKISKARLDVLPYTPTCQKCAK